MPDRSRRHPDLETAYDILLIINYLVDDAQTLALNGNMLDAYCLILNAQQLQHEFADVLKPFPNAEPLFARIATFASYLRSEVAEEKRE